MNTISEFVNAKSMVTPGFAGGLVMFITNAIDLQFGCGPYLPFFVLFFSFLVGIVVFVDQNVTGLIRLTFYLINSLVIFAVASGTNQIGVHATESLGAQEEEIKATIRPIGFVQPEDASYATFRLAQTNPPVSSPAQTLTENRMKFLQAQIITASDNIQLIQTDLVVNQMKYEDPKGKFSSLKRIYADLENVNTQVKRDTALIDETKYQAKLLDIQHQLQKLQNVLLLEKNRESDSRKFFKAWF